MSITVLILFIVIVTIVIGLGLYFTDIAPTVPGVIGFPYKSAGGKTPLPSTRVLAKLQQVMQQVQAETCLFVKPAWANVRSTFLNSASPLNSGTCSSQRDAILAKIDITSLFPADLFFSIPISDTEKDKVRGAIVDFFSQIIDETCDNDQVNVAKAVSLMDEMVAAFC